MPADIRAYLEIRTAAPSGFAPDGSRLLVSSDLPGTAQLYRLPTTGGPLAQVTGDREPVSGRYLPTRNRLLLAIDSGGNERHQLYLCDEDGGARTDLVVDPDHIHRPGGITRDGRLLAYATNRRTGADFDVWVRDLDRGEERCLFAPGGWCQPAGFSPDGRLLAVTRLTEQPGDNAAHLVDSATGDATELLAHDEPAQVGTPSWMPDGGAYFQSHSVGRDLVGVDRVDAGTGDRTPVFEGQWDTGASVDWSGRHLLAVRNAGGWTEAALHDPGTLQRAAEVPLPGRGVASAWSFSQDGRWLAYAFCSANVPGDVWVLDTATGEATRLTHSPCEVDGFVEPELVTVDAPDGERIPAFVFRPRDGRSGRRPVVVVVHGGPESQSRPGFNAITQYLVAHGFAVVTPNVRGSTGYGKRYEHLDDVERRAGAVADLAAVHDWLGTTDDLDPDRAALYGGSYGGWMVLMGMTHQPERWAAGVDIVGMSSLVTFLQNTAPWRRRFREREYGSLDRHRELLEELSPINRIDAIRAPLFVIHGRNDPRVPVGEAEQIHRVLSDRGVRCDLRIYEDEGHGLAKLANRIDAYPQAVAFLTEVLHP